MKRWTKRLILLAATTGAAAIVSAIPSRAIAQAVAPAISVDDARAADLQQQVSILSDPAAESKARDEAARRLASRNSPEARQALSGVLVNVGNPRGQLSVAKALASAGSTDPAWIDPLFALIGQDRALSDAACAALANYKTNTGVLNRLIETAQNSKENRENARVSVTKALGSFADKNAAKVLIDLLQSDTEVSAVHFAAADGLMDLTGLSENDRDVSLWVKWWGEQAGKSDALFRDDLLVSRSGEVNHLRQRRNEVAAELKSMLNEQYDVTPDTGKDAVLLKWMQSAEPVVRELAALKVTEDFNSTRQFGPSVNEQLRKLVGDSSPAVRLQVALTLFNINDTTAVDALLTQLSQESVAENKAQIAKALARMRDLRSVPELEKLLADDQPLNVTQAAADAFNGLGSTPNLGSMLYEKDPAAAKRIAAELRNVLDKRSELPGAGKLRDSLVQALVPLRDPEMLRTYFKLLNQRETEITRRAALKGLGELRNPSASDTIVAWLPKENMPLARKQAITALETTSGPEQFETLYQVMSTDSDTDVRAEAWRVFSVLLPQATTDQVNRWTSRFPIDPEKRVAVLKVLETKLVQDKNYSELAKTRQNIGETLMRFTPPQADEAAKNFKLSLEYFQSPDYLQQNPNPAMVIETNSRQLMDAYLQNKQYTDAATFGAQMIAVSAENRQTVGSKFKIEAESLVTKGLLQDAEKLIGEVNKMNPPLEGSYKSTLDDIEKDIQQRRNSPKNANGTTGPKRNPDLRLAQE